MLTNKLTGAGAADKTYIEDVFSTYLYTGNAATQTINNGIDLAGKGGMVWIKNRTTSYDNYIHGTGLGTDYRLSTNSSAAQTYVAGSSTVSLTSSGFTDTVPWATTENLVSFSFRKAPKFFDVVVYSGDGSTARSISHSLGGAPGLIFVKCKSAASQWKAWHTSTNTSSSGLLSYTSAFGTSTANGGTRYQGYISAADSTTFTVSAGAGAVQQVNASGASYIAYIFAHDTSTDGLIQCGSFTGGTSVTVDLGWEPQYVLLKYATGTSNWWILDNMRGMSETQGCFVSANSNMLEGDGGQMITPTSNGFKYNGTNVGVASGTLIYMAIRRGPMRTPTDATKVFMPSIATISYGTTNVNTGFPVDLSLSQTRSGNSCTVIDRLRGSTLTSSNYLKTNASSSEPSNISYGIGFDRNASISDNFNAQMIGPGNFVWWNFRRAPGFFDVVCYTGNGNYLTVKHNLGVIPELLIVKRRDAAGAWYVQASNYGSYLGKGLYLSSSSVYPLDSSGFQDSSGNQIPPTATEFYVGGVPGTNASSTSTYVAYLFASCPGVSKVGSYTGNGTIIPLYCGFTNGARFVMIKRTDAAGDWYVWDTARGIVAGNDSHLSLNTTAAEVTTDDTIDPYYVGCIVNQVAATNMNVNGATYIYLAIA